MPASFPWPRAISLSAGLCMLGGWVWDSLLLWALAAVLATVALVLDRRSKAKRQR
ncbi:hypothetical protein AB0M02_08800 [Actinoplanes sp. NPDC051861]|uniref:hypothetical protein n=1 Tax=Actinoplanes sp. NPDC051861 TaxID=3155170 RepID=UPI00344734C8